MHEAVLGLIALFAPRAVARRLAAIALQRELTTNTQLRNSDPARIAQFEEELRLTITRSARAFRRPIIGAGFFIASALVAAWLLIVVADIHLAQWLITTCSLVPYFVLDNFPNLDVPCP